MFFDWKFWCRYWLIGCFFSFISLCGASVCVCVGWRWVCLGMLQSTRSATLLAARTIHMHRCRVGYRPMLYVRCRFHQIYLSFGQPNWQTTPKKRAHKIWIKKSDRIDAMDENKKKNPYFFLFYVRQPRTDWSNVNNSTTPPSILFISHRFKFMHK